MRLLLVVDDNITEEELLAQISSNLPATTSPAVHMKATKAPKSLQGFCKRTALSTPPTTCKQPLFSPLSQFTFKTGVLRKIHGGDLSNIVEISNDEDVDGSTSLKIDNGGSKRKRRRSCEILKETLKRNIGSNDKDVVSVKKRKRQTESVSADSKECIPLECVSTLVSDIDTSSYTRESCVANYDRVQTFQKTPQGLEKHNACFDRAKILSSSDANAEVIAMKEYPFSQTDPDLTTSSPAVPSSARLNIKIPECMYVAVDCEMVGIGPKGKHSVLARCSIVDYEGRILYDKYTRPLETITDYRTRWSGIRPSHMRRAVPIKVALADIKKILAVLEMKPDHHFVRDTSQCKQLVQMANLQGQGNSLKKLSAALLDRVIQTGRQGHCSVEDARATLDLFKLVRDTWEPELLRKWSKKNLGLVNKFESFIKESLELGMAEAAEDFLHDQFWPSHLME